MESLTNNEIIDVVVAEDKGRWRKSLRGVFVVWSILLGLAVSGLAVFGIVTLLRWQGLPPATRALMAAGMVVAGIGLAIPALLFGSKKLLLVMRKVGQFAGIAEKFTSWSPEAKEHVRKSPMLAPMMVADLVKAGTLGLTIRRCPADRKHRVYPFDHLIEPVPLRETDASFRETDDAWTVVHEEFGAARLARGKPRWRPPAILLETRRLASSGGLVWMVVMINPIIQNVVRGGFWNRLTLALMGTGLLIAIVIHYAGFGGTRVWHVVAGGLVVGTDAQGRGLRRPRLVTRSSANLLANWSPGFRFWGVHVATAEATYRCFLSDSEFMMLMRAWLSPLAPPSEESLAELGLLDQNKTAAERR